MLQDHQDGILFGRWIWKATCMIFSLAPRWQAVLLGFCCGSCCFQKGNWWWGFFQYGVSFSWILQCLCWPCSPVLAAQAFPLLLLAVNPGMEVTSLGVLFPKTFQEFPAVCSLWAGRYRLRNGSWWSPKSSTHVMSPRSSWKSHKCFPCLDKISWGWKYWIPKWACWTSLVFWKGKGWNLLGLCCNQSGSP